MNVRPGSPNYTRARETLSHNFVLNSNAEAGSGDITVSGPVNVCVQSGIPLESNYSFAVTFGAGVTSSHYAAFAVERLPAYLRNQALQLAFDCYNSGTAGVYSVELHDNNNTVTPVVTAIGSGYTHHSTVFGSTASTSDYQIRFKSNSPGTLILNQLYVGRLVQGFSGSVSVSNTGTVNNTTNNYYSVSGGIAQSQLTDLSGVLTASISSLSGSLIASGQILRASDNLLNTAINTLSGAVIVSGQTVLDRLFLSGQILQNATPASITLTNYSGDIYTPRNVTVSGLLTAPSLTISGNVLTAQSGVLYVNGQSVAAPVTGYWGSYAPSISTGTKGTTALDVAHVWRRGKFAQIIYDYSQTGAGSGGSGTYRFSMPSGLVIDTNYTATESVTGTTFLGCLGMGHVNDSATINAIAVHAYDENNFAFLDTDTDSEIGASAYSLANTNLRWSVQLFVPIVGWQEYQAIDGPQAVTITWEASSGTDNGDSVASSWRNYDTDAASTMTLNNPNGYSWASIGSGNFTLSAGTYLVKAEFTIYDTNTARSRVYNVTDSAVAFQGVNAYSNTAEEVAVSLPCEGVISPSGTKSYRLEYFVNAGNTNRLGASVTNGDNEVYARITILKLR